MSQKLLQREGTEDTVLTLVKIDQALSQVSLRISRADRCRKEKAVGSFQLEGIQFNVFAEERGPASEVEGLQKLTNREMQIACLVCEGACNKQIARRLRISPYTVASYLKRMFPKLGCASRTELAAMVAHLHHLA